MSGKQTDYRCGQQVRYRIDVAGEEELYFFVCPEHISLYSGDPGRYSVMEMADGETMGCDVIGQNLGIGKYRHS